MRMRKRLARPCLNYDYVMDMNRARWMSLIFRHPP